jgi:RNA polymerase sigma factor (sigma-70 family)
MQPPPTDAELLSDYAASRSDAAFAGLVERYVGLVYSSALRQVDSPQLAEDITQAVFIILARKSGSLGGKTILPGWLCRTAHFVARDALRTERRRRHREQEAYMQSALNEPEPDVWPQVAPLLDEAVAQLRAADRAAIVLRFYEQRPLDEVGAALGIGADAAQKRVARALEKLRGIFAKRGVTLTSALIAGAVSANSVQAAPAALGASVATASLSKAAASTSVHLLVKATLQRLFWLNLRASLLVALAISLGGGGLALHRLAQTKAFHEFSWSKTYRVTPYTGAQAVLGPMPVVIKLTGTPGLPYELTGTSDGRSQTFKGVLPDNVSFVADGFTVNINVKGPGKFGYDLSRGTLVHASRSLATVTNTCSVTIEGLPGGQGIHGSIHSQ